MDVRGGRRPWSASTPRARSSPGGTPTWWPSRPTRWFTVDPQRLHHRNPVTPYAGRRLAGVVRDVWLHGERIVADGHVTPQPRGRLLRKERP